MFSQTFHQLVLVSTEVVRARCIVSSSDMSVVIIKRLFLDMLIFSSELLVPQVKVDSSLQQGHRLDIAANLVVVVADANCALP